MLGAYASNGNLFSSSFGSFNSAGQMSGYYLGGILGQSQTPVYQDRVYREAYVNVSHERQAVTTNTPGQMWDVWFDHQDGQRTQRRSPIVLDLNGNGKPDITGKNVLGDGKVSGEPVMFDIDPSRDSWQYKSVRRRPGAGAPRISEGTIKYGDGTTVRLDRHGRAVEVKEPDGDVIRGPRARREARQAERGKERGGAEYYDRDGNLVGELSRDQKTGRIMYHWGKHEEREKTEWLAKGGGDGLLVWDVDNDGKITSSKELTLLDRSTSALAACLAAVRMVEHDAVRFSANPVLERLHLAVEQGSDLREPVERTAALLRALRQDVGVLDERVWMGEELKAETVPLLREYLDQMDRALASIAQGAPTGGNRALPVPAAESAACRARPGWEEPLERLRWLSQQLDDLQEDLEDRLLDRPDLSRAGHFHELVSLMEGVYAGQVPDRALREQVEIVSRLQEAFRGRLQLHVVHHPEERAAAVAVLRCLDAQQVGLERVQDYLAGGDRALLPRALDALVGPTLELIAVRVDDEPAGAPAAEIACPFCGAPNAPWTPRCAQCARPLLLTASLGPGLDLYDGGAAPAEESLSENFGFVVQVIDDVEGGLVEPEHARDLLAPFWDTIHAVEQRSRTEVQPRVDALGDEERSRSQEDFTALLQAVKDAMADLLGGLADGRRVGYSDVRERMVDLAGLIGYVHREQSSAAPTL